jgi:hypothetical protein
MHVPVCAICDRLTPWVFLLCPACQEEYGDREDWEPWLKYMADQERAARQRSRREAAAGFHTVRYEEEPGWDGVERSGSEHVWHNVGTWSEEQRKIHGLD